MALPREVTYLRTSATMAFPAGRLLGVVGGQGYVLAPDGWARLGSTLPSTVAEIGREEAEEWCEDQGWPLTLLDDSWPTTP
ncbi:hypothetical protein C1701_08715 [Actinoalloteichus sp. AHMU CJ021]|uniref:Uncharacterized protein n=1 Tax=Actinoalloteichus caeruleus DSM 43889 TaxID=1120930 RepID=A0ABT1JJ42_ACTCY|nr:hypothetical protein [Actinoalloteichus caeruleus]AUS78437.1 hypothetical protein C1701_08715 [Actinoalloteichus sp. AHMU CJ021]MCP2332526.1 hypothetical protein [Actinoalloteichus caeruleus DSM 43889]